MKVICARGKQAESPVRGKFTLVWWGAEVEERRVSAAEVILPGQGWQCQRELHVLLVPESEEGRAPSE